MWSSHEAHPVCLLCRLPCIRYPHGHDVKRCCCHEFLLIAGTETCVSDLRASSQDYETREHHFSEHSRFNQGSTGFRASKEHTCLCKKQDINSCLGILLIGECRCRELSNFSPISMKIEDCDHVHGVRNLPRFESWHQDRFLWPGTWLDEDTKRNIISKLHLVLMCRQPESRMGLVNSRWCGNIERPSKP